MHSGACEDGDSTSEMSPVPPTHWSGKMTHTGHEWLFDLFSLGSGSVTHRLDSNRLS